jgi:glutamine---fructose-6-phosphate transaminase (isomerizing)
MSLIEEIREQPDVARRLLASRWDVIHAVARQLRERRIEGVMIAARGTSDHAAIYAQYLFGAFHGLPVALAAPSLFSVFGTPPDVSRWLVIGISQSGSSPDVVAVVEGARGQGAFTIALTNAAESALGTAAEAVIDVAAGPERSTAATKTYTAELLGVAMLAAAIETPLSGASRSRTAATANWTGTPGSRVEALSGLPSALAAALGTEDAARAAAMERAGLEQCVVLGRGFEYATAREWALKLKELAQVGADPYSSADFQHGPLALVQPGYPVLAVATRGHVTEGLTDLLRRLRRDYRVNLLVISDDAAVRDLGTAALAVPEGLPEWLTPIASILPAQLFCYHLTVAKGLDPDRPRWISKVTLTR